MVGLLRNRLATEGEGRREDKDWKEQALEGGRSEIISAMGDEVGLDAPASPRLISLFFFFSASIYFIPFSFFPQQLQIVFSSVGHKSEARLPTLCLDR